MNRTTEELPLGMWFEARLSLVLPVPTFRFPGRVFAILMHLFGRVSLLLMKTNTALIVNRVPTVINAEVDGTS